MTQLLEHMHEDLETLKREISVIKHVLLQEGRLKPAARKALKEARSTPDEEYVSHQELKNRIR